MGKTDIRIEPARPCHAPCIARAVMDAVGEEICSEFAAPDHTPEDVERLFTHLASLEDSQYSYRNTIIALAPDGTRAGAVVCYDGARLYDLREAFVREANRLLGWGATQADFADETSADEVYLDSLMVAPEYRRLGLGTRLIREAAGKAAEIGKPLGLLVDFDNPGARRVYVAAGFRKVGTRPFAGREMEHMQIPV